MHYDGLQELNLAIVVGTGIDESSGFLLDASRSFDAVRIVLVGPSLSSAEYPLALDAGFDEVPPI